MTREEIYTVVKDAILVHTDHFIGSQMNTATISSLERKLKSTLDFLYFTSRIPNYSLTAEDTKFVLRFDGCEYPIEVRWS